MVRLRELIIVLSDKYIQGRTPAAIDGKFCKICGGPATKFKSRFTKMEYRISAICEKCQEYYYLNADKDRFSEEKRTK